MAGIQARSRTSFDALCPAMTEESSARTSSQIMPRIGAVERLVAEREVGDDIAFDHHFQQRPLEPRRIAQMATRHAFAIEAHPGEHIATKRFGETETLAAFAGDAYVGLDRAVRQSSHHLLDQ